MTISPAGRHRSTSSSVTATRDSPLPLVDIVTVKGLNSHAATEVVTRHSEVPVSFSRCCISLWRRLRLLQLCTRPASVSSFQVL